MKNFSQIKHHTPKSGKEAMAEKLDTLLNDNNQRLGEVSLYQILNRDKELSLSKMAQMLSDGRYQEEILVRLTPAIGNQTQEMEKFSQRKHKKLFESLTTIQSVLTKKSNGWNNRHLHDISVKVMKLLNDKVEQMQAREQVFEVDNKYRKIILHQYILGGGISPIYRQYNSVKKIVPDIQGLVFDMVVLSNEYIKGCLYKYREMINPDKIENFKKSYEYLITMLLSSVFDSPLFNGYSDSKLKELWGITKPNNSQKYQENAISIEDLLEINSTDFSYSQINNMNFRSALLMSHFMGSCKNGFNIILRRLLTLHCTHLDELLGSISKLQSNKNLHTH